jgi:hypothetical protein
MNASMGHARNDWGGGGEIPGTERGPGPRHLAWDRNRPYAVITRKYRNSPARPGHSCRGSHIRCTSRRLMT